MSAPRAATQAVHRFVELVVASSRGGEAALTRSGDDALGDGGADGRVAIAFGMRSPRRSATAAFAEAEGMERALGG